ncbi:MAG: RNA polymerase sigma factor [Gemmataceae bacterium]
MPDSFPTVMRKLNAGDADAAAAIFEQYAARLIALARKHIDERVRSKVDQDDIAQSVFRTFFRRAGTGQFDLANEDGLWALLAEIAVRKCHKWNRHFHTRKRNAAREAAPDAAPETAARDPGPDEATALADLVEQLLRGLEGRERVICEQRLQGEPVAVIAHRAGCSEATVFRALDTIKARLEELLNADT